MNTSEVGQVADDRSPVFALDVSLWPLWHPTVSCKGRLKPLSWVYDGCPCCCRVTQSHRSQDLSPVVLETCRFQGLRCGVCPLWQGVHCGRCHNIPIQLLHILRPSFSALVADGPVAMGGLCVAVSWAPDLSGTLDSFRLLPHQFLILTRIPRCPS